MRGVEILGKITRQELSPGIRSELDKSGNLASLTTTDKSSLVGAVNEINGIKVSIGTTAPTDTVLWLDTTVVV